jgi:hypothetical protein
MAVRDVVRRFFTRKILVIRSAIQVLDFSDWIPVSTGMTEVSRIKG